MKGLMQFIFYVFLFVASGLFYISLTAPSDAKLREYSLQVFEMINEERGWQGDAPLVWDESMYELAKNYSQHIIDSGEYVHSDYGYAENLMNDVHPFTVYKAWENSFPHFMNMFNSEYTRGAVGMAKETHNIYIGKFRLSYLSGPGYTTLLMTR